MRNATKMIVSTLGTLAGLAGIEHGIGETFQGNMAPDGMTIVAWPGSELFRVLAGEPAMTIVPNLLVTGILAIVVSLIFLLWATAFVDKKNSSLVLILLSIAMLLVGAGYGSAILGLIVGLTATKINTPLNWWRSHLPAVLQRFLGRLWPMSYVTCVIAWLLLLPGTIILGHFFGADSLIPVIPVFILLAFGSMVMAIFTGFAYDLRRHAGNEGQRLKRPASAAGKAKA